MALHSSIFAVKYPHRDLCRDVTSLCYKLWQADWDQCTGNKLHSVKPITLFLCQLMGWRHFDFFLFLVSESWKLAAGGHITKDGCCRTSSGLHSVPNRRFLFPVRILWIGRQDRVAPCRWSFGVGGWLAERLKLRCCHGGIRCRGISRASLFAATIYLRCIASSGGRRHVVAYRVVAADSLKCLPALFFHLSSIALALLAFFNTGLHIFCCNSSY